MKDKFIKFGKHAWDYANSNVGSALVAASAAYVLTKGSTEEELSIVKEKLQKASDREVALEDELKELAKKSTDLLMAKISTESELKYCRTQKSQLWHAHYNSICFYKIAVNPELYTPKETDDNMNPVLGKK